MALAVPSGEVYHSQVRIQEASAGTGDKEAVKAYRNLQSRFEGHKDVSATLFDPAKRPLLVFKPKPSTESIQGAITPMESIRVRGQIVKLGGAADRAHIHLEDVDGFIYIGELQRELAKRIAQYLYGQSVELRGLGRWERDAEHWKIRSFRVEGFEVLDDEDVQSALVRMGEAMRQSGMNQQSFENLARSQSED